MFCMAELICARLLLVLAILAVNDFFGAVENCVATFALFRICIIVKLGNM